jgi:hypothetical protein
MVRSCKLELFTWTLIDAEDGGKDKIVSTCPVHASSKVRFGNFGTGIIVTCHEERDHLVRLCERGVFEAEQQLATEQLLEPEIPRDA